MQKTRLTKSLSLLLCIVLVAAIALFTAGCNNNNSDPSITTSTTSELPQTQATVIGEGNNQFSFTVTDPSGEEKQFTVKTDKTIVGEALQDAGLIQGEEGPYGLYVKTVNGITLDYDTDGKYWAFYVDGAYASSGVDTTEIKEGSVYSFKAEK